MKDVDDEKKQMKRILEDELRWQIHIEDRITNRCTLRRWPEPCL
ncbi:hypothetical protein ACFLV6_00915 [Chloroflexota bacterium]